MLIQNAGNTAQAGQAGGMHPNVGAKPAAEPGSPQAATKPAAEQQPSPVELKNAMDSANNALKQSNVNLEFSLDADTNKSVVKVTDAETGDMIRQFPSKEALAIFSAIGDIQQGLLLKQKA